MNTELITANEIFNNGKFIHLYYCNTVGAWLAFGYSAYGLKNSKGCLFSFSNEMQMPCATCSSSRLL